MGKQTYFYMLAEDERKFLSFLSSDNNLALIAHSSSDAQIKQIDLLDDKVLEENKWYLLIWPKHIPIESRHLQRVNMTKEVYDGDEPVAGIYFVDVANAPVIEYSRSFVDDNGVLVRGRVWAETREAMGENLTVKGKDFQKLIERVMAWFRRNLTYSTELGAYIGNKALQWIEEGREIR